jgi:hypothetical protein
MIEEQFAECANNCKDDECIESNCGFSQIDYCENKKRKK